MTAYILTPEQHAQIVDALEYSTPIAEFDDMQSEATAQIAHNTALAMLKSIKPSEPVAFAAFVDNGNIRLWSANAQYAVKAPHLTPLYAKEQQ